MLRLGLSKGVKSISAAQCRAQSTVDSPLLSMKEDSTREVILSTDVYVLEAANRQSVPPGVLRSIIRPDKEVTTALVRAGPRMNYGTASTRTFVSI